VIHPTKVSELLFEMEGLRARIAEIEGERDAAKAEAEKYRAGETRAVEVVQKLLKSAVPNRRDHPTMWDAWAFATKFLEGNPPALDWLAQVNREAAAEALEKVEAGWWLNEKYETSAKGLLAYCRDRAAALRAGRGWGMPTSKQDLTVHATILRDIAKTITHYAESSTKRLEWDDSMPDDWREIHMASIASQTKKAAALLAGAEALNEYQWRPIGQMGIRCEDWDRKDLYLFGRINARGVVEVVSAEFASWHGFTHAIRLPKFGGEVPHVG